MPQYFSYFPTVQYKILGYERPSTVPDITRRFKLTEALSDKATIYYDYAIQEGDRPDIVAAKYYKDSRLDWLVLLVNDIHDVAYDWPLDYQNFQNFIINKYGSIETAQSQVHHYEKILRAESSTSTGERLPEIVVTVDETTYNSLTSSTRRSVDAYTYEDRLNESKRNIRLIDRNRVRSILDELEDIYSDV
jgi:hypothetical protein